MKSKRLHKVSESKGYSDGGFAEQCYEEETSLDKDLVTRLEIIKICATMIAREKGKGSF